MVKKRQIIVNVVYECPLRHGQEDLDAQTELSFVVISLHPSSLTDAAYAHWDQNHSHFAFYYIQFTLDRPETKAQHFYTFKASYDASYEASQMFCFTTEYN